MVTHNIDLSSPGVDDGHLFVINATQDIDFTFSNYPAAGKALNWIVAIRQGVTGGHSIGWPAEMVNPPNIAPVANTTSLISIMTWDNGATVYSLPILNAAPSNGFAGNLSALNIDVNKDWNAKSITNIAGIAMSGVTATVSGVTNLNLFQAGQSINSLSGEVDYIGAALDRHRFIAGATEIARFEEITAGVYQLDMLAHKIKNSREHTFDNSTEAIIMNTEAVIGYSPSTEAAMMYNVPTGKSHKIKINDVDTMTVSTNNVTFKDGLQVIFNPDATNPGVNVGLAVGDPTATNNGDLWYNSTTNKFRTKENGVNVDVVGGGGGGSEVPLWTQDHDADGNTLILDVDGDSSISSVSDDSIQIVTGGNSELSVTNGFVTVPNSLIVNGNTTWGNASTDTVTINAEIASSLIPETDNTKDLGVNTTGRWRDLWLGRNASILGTIIVGGAASLLGNVQLGFSSSNTISFDGRVSTNILPNSDNSRDLGSSSLEFKDAYIDGELYVDTLTNAVGQNIDVDRDLDFPFGVTCDFNESQSSAGAGVATALPSKPEAYIKVKLNGVVGVVPWYPLS